VVLGRVVFAKAVVQRGGLASNPRRTVELSCN
jgi:hypothetical protein